MSEPYRDRENQYYYYKNPQDENHYQPTSLKSHQQARYFQQSRLSQMDSPTAQYVPKIIESGYIVGPPVAYTQQPSLPNNFNAFSPTKSNIPIILDTSNHHSRDISPKNSRILINPNRVIVNSPPIHQAQLVQNQQRHYVMNQPQPSIIINQPSNHNETVTKAQYDRCFTECKNWETKYNELHLKYMMATSNSSRIENYDNLKDQNLRLMQKIRDLENRQRMIGERFAGIFKQLVEKYKQSTLKETYLLMDRFRLQSRQR